MVIKYLSIFKSVIVIGPPLAIWDLKVGTTDPLESRTLPKRVDKKTVFDFSDFVLATIYGVLWLELTFAYLATGCLKA